MNTYQVQAHFERARFFHKVEVWDGRARNLGVALRRASREIMERRNVKRLRHARVTFTIEKIC